MSTATEQGTATGTTWKIDPAHSEVGFEVKHMMFAKVRGRFGAVDGTIVLSDDDASASSARAVIETGSIDTGVAQRDEHLRSPDFFDVGRFPEIRFESGQVERKGEGAYTVEGELTIRDVTRKVTLEVEETGRGKDPWGGTRAGFRATTTIDRRDFGLTWNQALETGGILVGNEVKIVLEVQAVLQAA